MRKPMSDATKKARAKKAAATREANKAKALELMGITARKKVRKKRTLTPEQKAAAVERLAKARAARGPSKNTMYAENVRTLPDEHTFSLKNVKAWIKYNKDQLSSMRGWKDSKDSKQRSEFYRVQTYVSNLENYLRTGVYNDLFFGVEGQSKIKYVCKAMAYYSDGTPKRTVGVLYQDIGVYTEEMAEANGDTRKTISNKTKVRKTRRRKSK